MKEHYLAIDVGSTSTHTEQVPNGSITLFNSLSCNTKLIITATVAWIIIMAVLRILEFYLD